MRYRVLACDYDRTIALNGVVPEATRRALREVRGSGRKLVLVTGRTRGELLDVFDDFALFDQLVLENGGTLLDPRADRELLLAAPVDARLVEELRRSIEPLAVGQVICSTAAPNEPAVQQVIERVGLDLKLTLNRDSIMVLPPEVDKAFGLRAALDVLGERAENTVAVGDGENDITLLEYAGVAVAVENAVDELKALADVVLVPPGIDGIRRLCTSLVRHDLADLLDSPLARRAG